MLRRLVAPSPVAPSPHRPVAPSPRRPVASVIAAYVFDNHIPPPRPIMRPAIPQAQSITNAFLPQRCRQMLVVRARRIIASDRQNDVHATECFEPRGVVLVQNEVRR